MFSLLNIGERAGSGIPNIFAVWKNQGWKEPKLEEQFNPDRTVLSLDLSPIGDKSAIKNGDKSVVETEDARHKIIEYIKFNSVCKASDISDLLNLKPSRTRDYLSMLVADNILVAEGANRNRVYRLKL